MIELGALPIARFSPWAGGLPIRWAGETHTKILQGVCMSFW